jgi:oligopeptide/dipeptide ABC transporter ATP-binding protein
MQAVFQDPWSSLNPRMRVREIIGEPLIVGGQSNTRDVVEEKVRQVLHDVGLDPSLMHRYPHEFSGGQRQRIAVAASLVSDPSLIILDEPVSALDVSIRAQIMNMFRDIQEQYGLSYLLIAHDLGTTRYMADKIAVMYLGKIVEYAETEELFENPLHPYTKALFSAALPSHPDIEREEIILEGEVPSPISPPSGCPFHPRCPMKIGSVCEEQVPNLLEQVTLGHWVSCHLYPESAATERS